MTRLRIFEDSVDGGEEDKSWLLLQLADLAGALNGLVLEWGT